jgi:hypothetical protein
VIAALRESHTVLVKGLSCNGIDLLGVGSEFNPRLWKRSPDGLTRFHLFSKPGKRLLEKTEHDVILSPEDTAYQMNTHTSPSTSSSGTRTRRCARSSEGWGKSSRPGGTLRQQITRCSRTSLKTG